MESVVPKCSNNNICSLVCNVKTCKAIPFMCSDEQCSCYSQHSKCKTNIRWKIIKQSFLNKLKKSSSQLNGYFTQIDNLYKSVIKQIEKLAAQTKNICDNFGLSQIEREVYQKLKEKNFTELTGELFNKVQVDLMQQKEQFKIRNIQKEKKQIEKQAIILVTMMKELTKLNVKQEEKNSHKSQTFSILDSKITQDVDTLLGFFPNKKITSMNLLYRASENNFQASKFWDKCDGKQHTITILKTEFGKVIGGYTPFAWTKSKNNKKDSSRQSFIFSLTNKHKLALIQGKQQYAIQYISTYIVIFGSDLVISDKANQNTNSGASPGVMYNYNNEYTNTQQSYKKFSGQSYGCNFKIQEWQLYQIVFG